VRKSSKGFLVTSISHGLTWIRRFLERPSIWGDALSLAMTMDGEADAKSCGEAVKSKNMELETLS